MNTPPNSRRSSARLGRISLAAMGGLLALAAPALPAHAADLRTADLAVTIAESTDVVKPNTNVTYTMTVKNNGPETASGAFLSAPLVPTAQLVSFTPSMGTCGLVPGALSCTLGDLASGAVSTVKVTLTAPSSGTVTASATVGASSSVSDPNPANNTATESTYIAQYKTTTTLTSTAQNSSYGQPVTFTAKVNAVGQGTLGNVPVTLTIDGTSYSLRTNSTTFVATFTSSALLAGQHTVTATFSSSDNQFSPSSASLVQTVDMAHTWSTIATSGMPRVFAPMTITATVNPYFSGGEKPTGTVTFAWSNGSEATRTVTLVNGTATIALIPLSRGQRDLTVTYSGSSNHWGSTGSLSYWVN
jgi:large repetitive protein